MFTASGLRVRFLKVMPGPLCTAIMPSLKNVSFIRQFSAGMGEEWLQHC